MSFKNINTRDFTGTGTRNLACVPWYVLAWAIFIFSRNMGNVNQPPVGTGQNALVVLYQEGGGRGAIAALRGSTQTRSPEACALPRPAFLLLKSAAALISLNEFMRRKVTNPSKIILPGILVTFIFAGIVNPILSEKQEENKDGSSLVNIIIFMVGPVSVIISLCIIIKQQKDLTRYIQTQHFADWRARGIITSVSYWAGSGHRRARIRLRLNPGAAALQQMPLGGMAPRQQQVMLTCPLGPVQERRCRFKSTGCWRLLLCLLACRLVSSFLPLCRSPWRCSRNSR